KSMHRLKSIVALIVTLAATSFATAAEAPRPNILYFIIDEWAYYEISSLGNSLLETPRIDQLIGQGMRFTQMLAGGPVCAPTRCALMTGKHAGHMTVRANGGNDPLRLDEVTIASMLHDAGYATGGFGKWGLGGRGTSGIPEKHGFDTFFGYYDQTHAHTFFPEYLVRNSQEVPLEGNTGDFRSGKQFSQNLIFDASRRFIVDNKDRPFFCYCCWTPPHGQWGIDPNDPAWEKYKDKPWTAGQLRDTDARIYAAMVNMVDRQIGQLVDLLKELKIDDRTLVVVTGDNGANDYFTHDVGREGAKAGDFRGQEKKYPRGIFGGNVDPRSGHEFRGTKGTLYEGGLRVPFIAWWPRKIAPGTVSDHLGYFPDLMPTIAEIAGVTPPDDIDGISIAPTLFGRGTQREHEYLYWEFQQQTAVRIGQMKGIKPSEKKPWALYDLDADISEETDVSKDHPKIVARMEEIAAESHLPARRGEIYEPDLVSKDRNAGKKGK
ncbi:MAG TPA: arylsulfatase, partial [Pirellulales bacterium]|nr:arylsulfatase [Pirellulales bacterium]